MKADFHTQVSTSDMLYLINCSQGHVTLGFSDVKFAQLPGNKAKIPTLVRQTLKSSSFFHKNRPLLANFHFQTHLLAHRLLFLTFETDKKYITPQPPKNTA